MCFHQPNVRHTNQTLSRFAFKTATFFSSRYNRYNSRIIRVTIIRTALVACIHSPIVTFIRYTHRHAHPAHHPSFFRQIHMYLWPHHGCSDPVTASLAAPRGPGGQTCFQILIGLFRWVGTRVHGWHNRVPLYGSCCQPPGTGSLTSAKTGA
jgi:hypothetical protein